MGGYADRAMTKHSERGLTLVEVMVSVFIFSLLMGSVFSVSAVLQRLAHEYQTNVALAADARMLMEKMVLNANDPDEPQRHGLREARGFAILSPSEIEFEDKGGQMRRLRSNGHNMELKRGGGPWKKLHVRKGKKSEGEDHLHSTSIEFTQIQPDVIEIKLVVGKKIIERWFYVPMVTKVQARNAHVA